MITKNKILIVDDEPINVMIAQRILEKSGYKTLTCDNGFDAMNLAVAEMPDLILLDVMMPEIDGFEVAKQLIDINETKDIPIIFLSALRDKDSLIKAFQLGGRDYVSKPFNKEELLARINTHVTLKKALEEQKRLVEELSIALEKIKTLHGLIPICSHCKKIRDDSGFWQKVEFYVQANSECEFSHSICPDCMEKYYPKITEKLRKKKEEENK